MVKTLKNIRWGLSKISSQATGAISRSMVDSISTFHQLLRFLLKSDESLSLVSKYGSFLR